MKKEEFYFDSKDGLTKIRGVRYIPEKEIIGILQISHGMCEFIDRYDKFAHYLCDNGFLVVGNDHLGHGESVTSKDNWGYFADKDGHNIVLEDLLEVTKITKDLYPNLPYFLLGHSMGSFFARYYMCKYGNELDGCIVMGTGQQNAATLKAGKVMCRAVAANKGWHYRSSLLHAMALGSYNKKWEPSNTHVDWLTKDNSIIEWYYNEPKCSFHFTANGFYNLFSVIEEVINKNNLANIPKDLPVFIVSGQDDPVGDFGKAPVSVYNDLVSVGIKDVMKKLYLNDRHEILNELDKEEVYDDIREWLISKTTEKVLKI